MLLYIHIIFSRTPITCLDHIKSNWPRDGIVRIDITRSGGQGNAPVAQDYSLHHSYAKEQRIHQREQFEYQAMFGFWGAPYRCVILYIYISSLIITFFPSGDCSSSAESTETDLTPREEAEETASEIYFNDTLTNNFTTFETGQLETLLPTEVTELDKIIRAGKYNFFYLKSRATFLVQFLL